jgi:hypothetical protein
VDSHIGSVLELAVAKVGPSRDLQCRRMRHRRGLRTILDHCLSEMHTVHLCHLPKTEYARELLTMLSFPIECRKGLNRSSRANSRWWRKWRQTSGSGGSYNRIVCTTISSGRASSGRASPGGASPGGARPKVAKWTVMPAGYSTTYRKAAGTLKRAVSLRDEWH